jgi:hypothetical protein
MSFSIVILLMDMWKMEFKFEIKLKSCDYLKVKEDKKYNIERSHRT